jgi:hypothetical protein
MQKENFYAKEEFLQESFHKNPPEVTPILFLE